MRPRTLVLVGVCAVVALGCTDAPRDLGEPVVDIPSSVTSGKSGLVATVTDADPDATYTWSGDFGTIDTGQGTPTITFTAGDVGTHAWTVVAALSGEHDREHRVSRRQHTYPR